MNNEDFKPGELIIRKNSNGTSSPVLIIGLVDQILVDQETLMYYLLWDGREKPYQLVKIKGKPLLPESVYKRL